MTERIFLKSNWLRLALICVGLGLAAVLWGPLLVDKGLVASFGGRRSMLGLGGLALALGAAVEWLPVRMRLAARWCLLLVAAVSAAMGADLFNRSALEEISPSSLAVRLTMLALVVGGLLLGGIARSRCDGEEPLDFLSFASVAGQVLLLALLMRSFQLESTLVYHHLMQLCLYGYLVHVLLDAPYRLPFFLALTLISILCLFGAAHGLWLIGAVLAMVAACHLPIPFAARVGVLFLLAFGLAAARIDWITAPWSSAIWPVLGSILMFRLMIYVYDLRHQKDAASPWLTLSYFFMLPNVAFPLFPVVDYATFRRTYFDEPAGRIARRGAEWMGMGVLQLLLYRVVYYYLIIPQSTVDSPGDLLRFVVFNYALYLRLSGQFHLIAGLLHLFGFNLPLTHHYYFLASSFTDFWRRINIYWKEYMQKLFYFPLYFPLRSLGMMTATVIATILVFVLTWFLHAYQYFWLRGQFLMTDVDILFWVVLGVLVVINTVWEMKHGRERATGAQLWAPRRLIPLALRTLATFGLLCVVWSMWTSDSIAEWSAMWTRAGLPLAGAGALVPLALTGAFVLGEWLRLRLARGGSRLAGAVAAAGGASPSAEWRLQLTTAAIVALVWLAGLPAVTRALPGRAQDVVRDLAEVRLNEADAARMQRGYYEDLLGVEKFNSALWELYSQAPPDWRQLHQIVGPAPGFLHIEIPPDAEFQFKRAQFRSNRWGMRDRDYEQTRPEGVFRIALLGSSHVMGSAVSNEQVFEALLEERLNSEHSGGSDVSFEILNFAVDGYSPIEQLVVLPEKVAPFQPDAVLFVSHADDYIRTLHYVATAAVKGIAFPFEPATDIVARSGVRPGMTEIEARERLRPLCGELLPAIYRRLAEDIRSMGARPLWLFLQTLEVRPGDNTPEELEALAAAAGFETFLLSDVYAGQDPKSIRAADWDWHPNAAGHRLIAERLFQALRERPAALRPAPRSE